MLTLSPIVCNPSFPRPREAVVMPIAPHLDLGESGLVYLTSLPDAHLFNTLDCGFVGCAIWPSELGAEPEWFGHEIGQLQDWWDRDRAFDEADVLSVSANSREEVSS